MRLHCVVVIGKFVCFIMFRLRSAISTTRNFVQSCVCARVRFDLRYAEIAQAISTTRECRLKCMSLVINVQSSVTKRFYQEVAIRDKQSIWRFVFRCAAAQKLRSVCKRALRFVYTKCNFSPICCRTKFLKIFDISS